MTAHSRRGKVTSWKLIGNELGVAVALAAVAILIAGAASMNGERAAPISSEMRFTDASRGGLQIVPASCASDPHYEGQCTPDYSACVSHSIPTTVYLGFSFSAAITFNNVGTNTWSAARGYDARQSPMPPGQPAMLPFQAPFPSGTVLQGQSATFDFVMTAPMTPGVYSVRYQMAHNGAGFTAVCGRDVTVSDVPPEPADNCLIAAAPSTVDSNGTSYLGWSTAMPNNSFFSYESTGSINNGIGAVATSGSMMIQSAQTTTYTYSGKLKAYLLGVRWLAGDSTFSCSTTVNVGTCPEGQVRNAQGQCVPEISSCINGSQSYTTAGTYEFEVPSTFSSLTVEVWGGGGGGGSAGNYGQGGNGGNGIESAFASLLAGGGTGGISATCPFYGCYTTTGTGGAASGGDENVHGNPLAATQQMNSTPGGSAPNGGAGGSGGANLSYGSVAGGDGYAPGAGGGGGWWPYGYGGGGGSGGYVKKSYTSSSLPPGSGFSLSVGAAGSAGQGSINGGAGANGKVLITCNVACQEGETLVGDQCVPTDPPCTSLDFCYAGVLYHQDEQCINTPIGTCGEGGSDVSMSIKAIPSLVRQQETTTVYWKASNVNSCAVTGTNNDGPWSCSGSECANSHQNPSSGITGQTRYTLLCSDAHGGSMSTSTVVNILPFFCEPGVEGCPL